MPPPTRPCLLQCWQQAHALVHSVKSHLGWDVDDEYEMLPRFFDCLPRGALREDIEECTVKPQLYRR